MIISQIVAASENNVIGTNNTLPWHIPEDLKFYKETTLGKILIMGRKTYEDLGKALPKRLNIVITRQPNYKLDDAIVVPSLEEAYKVAEQHHKDWPGEVFINGGGEIYRLALPTSHKVYLTRIHKDFEGETTYPELPEGDFKEVSRREGQGEVPITFHTFERVD